MTDVGSQSCPCLLLHRRHQPGPNRFLSSTTAGERHKNTNFVVVPRTPTHILIPFLTSGTCCIGGSADVDAPPPEISALLLLPNIDVIDRPMSSDFAILLLVPAEDAPPSLSPLSPLLPLGCGVRRLLISGGYREIPSVSLFTSSLNKQKNPHHCPNYAGAAQILACPHPGCCYCAAT